VHKSLTDGKGNGNADCCRLDERFFAAQDKRLNSRIQGGKGSMIIWKNPDETFYKELYLEAIEKM